MALKRADFFCSDFSIGGLYFFFGVAFFGFTAVFGRGAFGFLVGTLAAFLALDGDFLGLAGDARFSDVLFTAAFFGNFAFPLATRCFFLSRPLKHHPGFDVGQGTLQVSQSWQQLV